MGDTLKRMLPPWLRDYPRARLGDDVSAGIIVAILVIPQSLAYALLAGLPPQAGLYISTLPVIVYALLGSSMRQAVGPVALTAILTATFISPLAAQGSAAYGVLAACLALLSGLILLAFGVLRLGFLSKLLSRPVVSGFISGSAVIIIFSQLRYLLGILPQGAGVPEVVQALVTQLPVVPPLTALFGLGAMAALIFARVALGGLLQRVGLSERAAAFVVRVMPLVVVLAATLLVTLLHLDGP